MGVDEQKEEREVLESIFPDEITGTFCLVRQNDKSYMSRRQGMDRILYTNQDIDELRGATSRSLDISETEFRVSIQLDVTDEAGGEGEDAEAPLLLLKVEYTPGYPDEAPRLDLLAPPNAPKHKYFDIQEDKGNLLSSLDPIIEESLGMAMVFTLVSSVKDGAELLISERQKAAQALRDVAAAKAEEEENRKFHGTPVTRDTFLAWRERFREEMAEEERRRKEEAEAEELKKKKSAREELKMTGRQLWERGLAGKAGEEDEDGGTDALAEAVATNVKIEV